MPQPPQRQITKEFASALLSTGSVATSLVIGVAAVHAAWILTPAHWFGDLRIIVAGALCVAVAAGAESLLGIILDPLRRRLWSASTTAAVRAARPAPPVAKTQEEGLAQLTAATIADAAHRAAIASWSVDHGSFLNSENRWRGYPNGDAAFYLAPGAVLHCQFTQDHNVPEFTLLTNEADAPVEVSTIRQVLDHLVSQKRSQARAALAKETSPLPAAQPEATVTGPAF
ncbi:hypothetical protein [Streptomyces sp. NBC_01174]|uniref:hypothetical protein n=1 Tax=Streptomyces sp. NBC_01174 TaxID=2903758 RepID=UPI002F90A32B|nr:hypothetical protein OG414_40260 [Streptomyces sp. NBC_01174]